MSERAKADAIKLLRLLLQPCEGTSDHAWRKCRRCAAVHGIEMRFSLSMRLLQTAVDELAAHPAPETLGDRAVAYMASDMGMTEPDSDQQQNWLLGHLMTFALRMSVNAGATPPEKGVTESAQDSSSPSVSSKQRKGGR